MQIQFSVKGLPSFGKGSKMRSTAVLAVSIVLIGLLTAGCFGNNSDINDTQKVVNTQQQIYNEAQPIHQYPFSNERELLQTIYDIRTVGNINTWTVAMSNNGIPLDMCASKGFPLPYSVELTNPEQAVNSTLSMPQADPNGLYPTGTTSATWVVCLNTNGTVRLWYAEPLVMAYTDPIEIQVIDGVKQIVHTGGQASEVQVNLQTGTPLP